MTLVHWFTGFVWSCANVQVFYQKSLNCSNTLTFFTRIFHAHAAFHQGLELRNHPTLLCRIFFLPVLFNTRRSGQPLYQRCIFFNSYLSLPQIFPSLDHATYGFHRLFRGPIPDILLLQIIVDHETPMQFMKLSIQRFQVRLRRRSLSIVP